MDPLWTAGLSVAAIGLLVLVSAFFSSSEIAVFTVTDESLAGLADATDPRVAVLQTLRGDPHRLLVTILVGNNVVNVAIGSLTTVLAMTYLPPGTAVTVATVVASVVVLVCGEIVPKSYGLGNAQEWALRVARPLRIVGRVLLPVVVVFDVVTRYATAAISGDPHIEEPYLGD